MTRQPEGNGEFFIGWEPSSPPAVGRFVRRRTLLIVALALAASLLVAGIQGTIDTVHYVWEPREFRGVLVSGPAPLLVADEPDELSGANVYYLARPWKLGVSRDLADEFHLRGVTLRGILFYREDGQAMIEIEPGSIEATGETAQTDLLGQRQPLGPLTLRGEIVDSKCYLGVMNPGTRKPHRACAIQCIEGGIPPILLVRGSAGARADYFLLVDEKGQAVNDRIADYVGLPIEITGRAERLGDRLLLRAPLSGYRLLE